jgi:hypothetical protein
MKPKATKSPPLRPRAGSRQGQASFSPDPRQQTPWSLSRRIACPRALAHPLALGALLWPHGLWSYPAGFQSPD